MYQPVFTHSYNNIIIINLNTSSVDDEHEFLTEVARVRSLPEGFHHQIGRRICMYKYVKILHYTSYLSPFFPPLPFPLPPFSHSPHSINLSPSQTPPTCEVLVE